MTNFSKKYPGICNNELKWFIDYLTNRRQCADLAEDLSQWINVKVGVTQRSILGPILFLIYVNGINNTCSEADFAKFADERYHEHVKEENN